MRKPTGSARRTAGRPGPKRQPVQRKTPAAVAAKSVRKNGAAGRAVEARPAAAKAGRVLARATAVVESEASTAASRGKYVYCIIEANDPLRFGPIGIGADPSDVYTVHYRTLAAVVSDAPLEVLDSTRENVLAHERVNETVMREHTVIPMSFGTIFKTREDIVELLRSATC
jgi:hypothetical protein